MSALDLVKLRNQLIEHEGLRLHPYRCTAGKLTIGVGRNLDDHGISKDEAMVLLDNDLKRCIDGAGTTSRCLIASRSRAGMP